MAKNTFKEINIIGESRVQLIDTEGNVYNASYEVKKGENTLAPVVSEVLSLRPEGIVESSPRFIRIVGEGRCRFTGSQALGSKIRDKKSYFFNYSSLTQENIDLLVQSLIPK